ncbi:doublesex- and mab-3-related transcription factor A1-like [Homarus americanus]|uniref:Doublesex-like n=1 Tax=Homarus americanus TaxID=6706 RepID=A0A8J5T7H3_HOMAM|nr:doublesex- and mab-3-related transcription factor A1-like [Homarus americanus]KAG7173176.1 doublesex-like [Homarus americanus]
MAMAPKKKIDFFNGGRGVDRNEPFCEQDPRRQLARPEVVPESYGYGGDCGRYPPSSPGGYMPPNSPSVHQYHSDYPHPSSPTGQQYHSDFHHPTTSRSQSPTAYDIGQEGYTSSGGYPPNSPSDFGGSSGVDGTAGPSSPADNDSRKKKRKQQCRLCANHGAYVQVKGHKWYCPYRENHTCEKCTITKKRQFYMAEQQKLTREQQQTAQRGGTLGGCGIVGGSGGGSGGGVVGGGASEAPCNIPSGVPMETTQAPRQTGAPTDFPRLAELVRETSNIINEDFFAMIDKVVRPKAQH